MKGQTAPWRKTAGSPPDNSHQRRSLGRLLAREVCKKLSFSQRAALTSANRPVSQEPKPCKQRLKILTDSWQKIDAFRVTKQLKLVLMIKHQSLTEHDLQYLLLWAFLSLFTHSHLHQLHLWCIYISQMLSSTVNDFKLAISHRYGKHDAVLIISQISEDLLKQKEKLRLH